MQEYKSRRPKNQDCRRRAYRTIPNAAEKEKDGAQAAANNTGRVASIFAPEIANAVFAINRINNGITPVTPDAIANPTAVAIIPTYAPHRGHREEFRKEHWRQAEKELSKIPKGNLL